MKKIFSIIAISLICLGVSAQKKDKDVELKSTQSKIDSLNMVCSDLQDAVKDLENELKQVRAHLESSTRAQQQIIQSNSALCDQMLQLGEQMKQLAEAVASVSIGNPVTTTAAPEFEIDENTKFVNGLAVVRNKIGIFGVINTKGELVVPFEYENMDNFSADHLAFAMKGSKWGVINDKNEVKLDFEYDEYYTSRMNEVVVYKVSKSGKWGVLSSNLSSILPCQFDYIGHFYEANGSYTLRKGDYYALADKNGKMITSFIYTYGGWMDFTTYNQWTWYTNDKNGNDCYINMNGYNLAR